MVCATADHFYHAARPLLANSRVDRDFTSLFGCRPEVCALAWNLLDVDQVDNEVEFKHFLWALMFMKTYAKETTLCSIAGVCRKTYRTWVWKVIMKIAGLRTTVVRFLLLTEWIIAVQCSLQFVFHR